METHRLVIDADGRVRIPNAKPGQVAIVHIEFLTENNADVSLTLKTAETDDERQVVIARVQELATMLRERLKDHLPISTDELYDDHGLPG
ncbi:MAG: hypothetical protein R2839_11710 [Thermomicrobiales bacterium]